MDAGAAALASATKGFDDLFSNRLADARTHFASENSPFHLLGLGTCAFLEAAFGMESALLSEAARCLAESEAGCKKQSKTTKAENGGNKQFPPGIEYEILQADAVVLQGLVNALSESYMGYLQCLYALNSAHSKFTKLYKTIFPSGMDSYTTPAASPLPSRNSSTPSLLSVESSHSTSTLTPPSSSRTGSFFGRLGLASGSNISLPKPAVRPEGPIEEMIVSGTAFGFGLFNLVFSLLPGKVKTVVGFFGFQHDRKLALQALSVSAARKDVHSVFAGLTLMTYHGVVLLLAGYQADEAHIVKQYKAIVDKTCSRYPEGALWILNKAKILRMTQDPDAAIAILQDGLKSDRESTFQQADALLLFELAWTLLSQRRYKEAADSFLLMTERNSWSHATYYSVAAGCYLSLGDRIKAKELFDKVPELLDGRKIHGKDLPTEVLIRKKLAFYKAKAKKRGLEESAYVDVMHVSLAEELAIFWNTHQRVTKETAIAHIHELSSYTPKPPITSEYIASTPSKSDTGPDSLPDLDTADELAIRSLILGIAHRTLLDFVSSRKLLSDAHARYNDVVDSKWVGGVALFELAVLDLKEMEARERGGEDVELRTEWMKVMKSAGEKLEKALAISGSSVDLSSRLDSRINMLRDEISTKKEMLGIKA